MNLVTAFWFLFQWKQVGYYIRERKIILFLLKNYISFYNFAAVFYKITNVWQFFIYKDIFSLENI